MPQLVAAETRDRTGDLQIFSLTLSQLSYRGQMHMDVALLISTRGIGQCSGALGAGTGLCPEGPTQRTPADARGWAGNFRSPSGRGTVAADLPC